MAFGTEGSRNDDRLHAGHGSSTCRCHRLEGAASNEDRVELTEEAGEINIRVHHNPVGLAFRPCDVTIQAHRNGIAYSSHSVSVESLSGRSARWGQPSAHKPRADERQESAEGNARAPSDCYESHDL